MSKPESHTQDEAPTSVIFHINEQKIEAQNVSWRHFQVGKHKIRCIENGDYLANIFLYKYIDPKIIESF